MLRKSLITALVLGVVFSSNAKAEIVESNAYDYLHGKLGFTGATQTTDQMWQMVKGPNGDLFTYDSSRSNQNIARYNQYIYYYMGFYDTADIILGHPGSDITAASTLMFVAPVATTYTFDVTMFNTDFNGAQQYIISNDSGELLNTVVQKGTRDFNQSLHLDIGETINFSMYNYDGYGGDGFKFDANVSYDDNPASDVSAPLAAGIGLSLIGALSLRRKV